ncbi:MAG TPA: thioredoxin domain-containing protein [Pyrinomonadaceae bacterium]|jgi:protein-disulfide isomerase|nr:thioredoxin domain-containing protein [Pyrinomonadaceae bacterium]
MKKYLPFAIIIIVLVAAVGGSFVLWKNRGGSTANSGSTFATTPPVSNSPAPNQTPNDTAGLTRPNVKVSSPVIIEEFGDYQCPPCGQLYPELKQIESEYGDQVKIVFRHFPLMKMHKNALLAAHAAEAARNQNRFWEMHDRLYRNQKEWAELDDPRPVFEGYARQLNLKLDQFNSDLQSNLIDQKISADLQRGTSQGVTGTPTVFLDSHLLKYEATNLDGLRRGINILLQQKAGS